MIKLIFATNNQHKVDEIQAAIGDKIKIVTMREAGLHVDIPEPHDTLELNAEEKSSTVYGMTGENCFSEDSGLEVDALNGEPGVKSARYAGDDNNSDHNIEKLLNKLGRNTNRKARFRTVISLIYDGMEHQFEGVCEGRILEERTGQGGFGYDPIFVPDGAARSFGEMNMEEKNQYSHRRKAADQLISFLKNLV